MSIGSEEELEGLKRTGRVVALALEPIVSMRARCSRTGRDGWTISGSDGSLTAHYENTVVIMRGMPLLIAARRGRLRTGLVRACRWN